VSAANNGAGGDDADLVKNIDDSKASSDTDSEPFEELNVNSNNGNDLTDEDSSSPTICVYGSNGIAGPFDLDITANSELPDESYCECSVSTFSQIVALSVHFSVHRYFMVTVSCTVLDELIKKDITTSL